MSWVALGIILPGEEWQYLIPSLSSRLIRLSYIGDPEWLRRYQPRAYLRLQVENNGSTEGWNTLWPKQGELEVIEVRPVLIGPNFVAIRKRRNPKSLLANYSIQVEEFQAEPYLFQVAATPFTVDGEPLTIDGEPLLT